MLNPGTIVNAWVSTLQSIPELVTEMDGKKDRIQAYFGRFPDQNNLYHAIYSLPQPSILVAYSGFAPGARNRNEVWKHRLSIIVRLRPSKSTDTPEAHAKALWLLVNGKPTRKEGEVTVVSPVSMLYYTIHDDCEPMDVPQCQRQTVVVDQQGTILEYWQFDVSMTEIGDAQ